MSLINPIFDILGKRGLNYLINDKPKNKDIIPIIEPLPGYRNLNELDMERYRRDINIEEISIVNGMPVILVIGNLKCSLCEHELVSFINNEYYYCSHCFGNICKRCQKNNLHDCDLSHSKQRGTKSLNCDLCNYPIIDNKVYHKVKEDDPNDSIDVCLDCSKESERGKMIIDEYKLELIDFNNDFWEFGSINDWVPIMMNDERMYILINYNSDSKYNGNVALVFFGKLSFLELVHPMIGTGGSFEIYTIQKNLDLTVLQEDIMRCLSQNKVNVGTDKVVMKPESDETIPDIGHLVLHNGPLEDKPAGVSFNEEL